MSGDDSTRFNLGVAILQLSGIGLFSTCYNLFTTWFTTFTTLLILVYNLFTLFHNVHIRLSYFSYLFVSY